jgi:hypothetical protein
MLCSIILIIIINFIIYIEGSMAIFIVYIGVVKQQSHFDYTNFKASLVIKIINFNRILKMTHLIMLVIFYVDMITFQIFNLPHIYRIFATKNSFFEMKNFKLVTWYLNMFHIT